MDFKRLIENGTYSKDNLTPKQQAFIGGIEAAKEEVACYKSTFCCDIDGLPTLSRIADEVAERVLDSVINLLDIQIAEHIVAFEDNNEAEKG